MISTSGMNPVAESPIPETPLMGGPDERRERHQILGSTDQPSSLSGYRPLTPLRILVATPRYAPEIGGVQRCVQEVARRVAAAGCHVTVLTTDSNGSLPPEEEAAGVSIRRVQAWPRGRDYRFAPDIMRIIDRGKWDLLHVQSYHTLVAPLAMLAARRRKLPYVLTFHSGGHSSFVRNALRDKQLAVLRPLLARADVLVAVAKFEIEQFAGKLRLPAERFVLIPNGGDLPRLSAPTTRRVTGTTIASVGRLERYKGHHRILAALPYIADRRPDVRLWIAGSGNYEPALRRLATRLKVADRVTIETVPPGAPELMAERLMETALVVLLSDYETHPIAVLEAAALGRPLLLADSPGLRELAELGLGRVIPLDSNPAAVAAAALEELDRPIRPRAFSLPTWDDCAAAYLKLYGDVVARSA
jgi:glycosyltransferase involved in cell wall biosynthesis